jgi:acetyl esterase/lipase
MTEQMGGHVSGVKETDHDVAMRDGAKITVRSYQPEQAPEGGSALYVMFHGEERSPSIVLLQTMANVVWKTGGGFCIGGLENEELLCRLLCDKYGLVVLNVDYRLAPEHIYPTAVHDCYDATKYHAIHPIHQVRQPH